MNIRKMEDRPPEAPRSPVLVVPSPPSRVILGLDIGLTSLGWALSHERAEGPPGEEAWSCGIVDLQKFATTRGEKKDYCLLVHRAIEDMKHLWGRASVVLIERQMNSQMRSISIAFRCFFWGKSVFVSPLAVRRFFSISCGNYADNKKESIRKCLELFSEEEAITSSIHGAARKQKSDLADAVLLVAWFIQSNPLPPGSIDPAP